MGIIRKHSLGAAAALAMLLCELLAAPVSAAGKGDVLIHQMFSGGDAWSIGLRISARTLDGKLNSKLFGKPVPAPAGRHRVGLHVEFDVKPKNAWIEATDRYADIVELDVTLEPGHEYRANGTQNGTYVEVWLEDMKNREVISDVVAITVYKCKPFKKCPRPKVERTGKGIY